MAVEDINEYLKLSRAELIRELKKIDPVRRIEVLKEIEKARKREEVETKKLLEESISEAETNQALNEIELPEEDIDINRLFGEQETLESQVLKHPQTVILDQGYDSADYQKTLLSTSSLYSQLQELSANPPTAEYNTMNQAVQIYDEILDREKYHSQDENVKMIAEGSRRIMKTLFGEYKAKQEYRI